MADQALELLQEVRADVKAIRRVLYEGNGQPPLLTRVDRLEVFQKREEGRDKRRGSRAWDITRTFIAALLGALLATFGAGLV